jgi:A/G-specific adenine glycosylase
VRNLKKAAQVILERHGGVFPHTYEEVLALPGIGAYTAGAICSICYDLPTPAVDGNVLRLVSRLTREETAVDDPAYQKQVRQQLAQVYPERAGDFTQGLMELGATVCGPNREPDCGACPCKAFCQGYLHGDAAAFPVRKAKKEKRREEMTLFILSCDGQYALRKRPDRGLLAGLWEFPNVPQKLNTQAIVNQVEQYGLKTKDIKLQVERKHIFTHIEWNMCGAYVEVDACEGSFVWMTAEQLQTQAALPTAFRLFWEELKNDETH